MEESIELRCGFGNTGPTLQNEHFLNQYVGFDRDLTADTGPNSAQVLEPVEAEDSITTGRQNHIAQANTVINQLDSLLGQARQQQRQDDEALIADAAGSDRVVDRTAHVSRALTTNDIVSQLANADDNYICSPLCTTAEVQSPSTSTAPLTSRQAAVARIYGGLDRAGHLSLPAEPPQPPPGLHGSHRPNPTLDAVQPIEGGLHASVRPAPLIFISPPEPPDDVQPSLDGLDFPDEPHASSNHIIDVSRLLIQTCMLPKTDLNQGCARAREMTGETSYPSPRSEGPAGSPTTMAPSEQVTDKPVSPTPVEVTRPRLAIKRDREPPRNAAGQLYCDHPDCKNSVPTFRRPCEWNKHMDKHDRPYKCLDPECDKLAGFTYSGGLLRHQREVHKMHSSGKRLMCPFPNCNRSSGKGFTRQENLKEHIRRLHKTNGVPAPDISAAQNNVYGTGSAATLLAPTSQSTKRRRLSNESSHASEDNVHALREEVMRLRREAQEKDLRLDELEKTVAELRQKIDSKT